MVAPWPFDVATHIVETGRLICASRSGGAAVSAAMVAAIATMTIAAAAVIVPTTMVPVNETIGDVMRGLGNVVPIGARSTRASRRASAGGRGAFLAIRGALHSAATLSASTSLPKTVQPGTAQRPNNSR
jgi:hypothetical protein